MGTYQPNAGNTQCLTCPAHSTTTTVGSAALSDCMCEAGYSGEDPTKCAACTFATYKSSIGRGSCTSCPENTNTSSVGATSSDQCQCAQGYFTKGNQQICNRTSPAL